MENTIEIVIKSKHFKNATQFTDNGNCPLALAVKEHFNNDDICVTTLMVYDKKTRQDLYSLYWGVCGPKDGLGRDKNGEAIAVDDLIKRAKQKKKVGSYTVVLTKIN